MLSNSRQLGLPNRGMKRNGIIGKLTSKSETTKKIKLTANESIDVNKWQLLRLAKPACTLECLLIAGEVVIHPLGCITVKNELIGSHNQRKRIGSKTSSPCLSYIRKRDREEQKALRMKR